MTNVPFPFPGNTDNQVDGLGADLAAESFDLADQLVTLGEVDPTAAPFLAQYEIGAQIDSVIQQPFEVLDVSFEISPAPIVNATPIEQPVVEVPAVEEPAAPVVSPTVEEPAAPVVSPTVEESPAAAEPVAEEAPTTAPKAAARTTKAAPKA